MESLFPGLTNAPNLHPFLVHFPIVLWTLAWCCWIVGAVGDRDGAWRAGSFLLWFAVLAAVPTVATGLGAEEQYHHTAGVPMDKIHTHRNFMLATSAAAALVAVAAHATRHNAGRAKRCVLLGALGLVNVVMFLGADRGAELVLRHGVGTQPGEASWEQAGGMDGAGGRGGHEHR